MGEEGVVFVGPGDGSAAGYSVDGAGDVNGDGYGDFLVGTHNLNVDCPSNSGAAALLLGGPA